MFNFDQFNFSKKKGKLFKENLQLLIWKDILEKDFFIRTLLIYKNNFFYSYSNFMIFCFFLSDLEIMIFLLFTALTFGSSKPNVLKNMTSSYKKTIHYIWRRNFINSSNNKRNRIIIKKRDNKIIKNVSKLKNYFPPKTTRIKLSLFLFSLKSLRFF